MKHVLRLLVCLLIVAPASAQISPTQIDSIPMRDGKKLAADVYITPNSSTAPTIFIFTPYGRQLYQLGGLPLGIGYNLSLSNYNIVIVDWRCRGGSMAACIPSPDNGQDGYDVVQWISTQSWSDGQVGMWGPSALGRVQYLTAKEHPAALKCIVPLVAGPQYDYEEYYPGGVYRTEYVQQLDALGFGMSTWILAAPTRNLFWQYTENVTDYPDSINVPTFMIGGWYDHTPTFMTEFFDHLRTSSPVAVRNQHRLLMGPWVHGGSGPAQVGSAVQGQLTYTNAAHWNDSLALAFFDYHLRNIANNWNNTPYVQYYQMGDDAWQTSSTWPPSGLQNINLYLHSGGALDGYTPTNSSGSGTIVYDPRDPSPTVGGPTLLTALDQGPYDQAPAVESRNDILTYSTVTLPQDVVMKGRAQAHLYVTSDQYDSDFAVRITDVYPDGRSMYVVDGIIRLRFRDGFAPGDTSVITPGQVYPVTIDFPPTAITFKAGHKIRVDVTSSIYPQYDCNLNDGGPMYTAGDTATATNQVFVNTQYASYVTFPLVDFNASVQEQTSMQNVSVYPNPSSGNVQLMADLETAADVSISIVDVTGQLVQRMDNVHFTNGMQTIMLPVSSLAPGVYFVTLCNGAETVTRKMIRR